MWVLSIDGKEMYVSIYIPHGGQSRRRAQAVVGISDPKSVSRLLEL